MQRASPPVGGKFSLSLGSGSDDYGGQLNDLSWEIEVEELKSYIESLAGIETVTVEREGSCRGSVFFIGYKKQGINKE